MTDNGAVNKLIMFIAKETVTAKLCNLKLGFCCGLFTLNILIFLKKVLQLKYLVCVSLS